MFPTVESDSTRYELGSTKNLPLQRHLRALHARLVGTIPIQFFSVNLDVVYSVQWISLLFRALQEASFMKPGHNHHAMES